MDAGPAKQPGGPPSLPVPPECLSFSVPSPSLPPFAFRASPHTECGQVPPVFTQLPGSRDRGQERSPSILAVTQQRGDVGESHSALAGAPGLGGLRGRGSRLPPGDTVSTPSCQPRTQGRDPTGGKRRDGGGAAKDVTGQRKDGEGSWKLPWGGWRSLRAQVAVPPRQQGRSLPWASAPAPRTPSPTPCTHPVPCAHSQSSPPGGVLSHAAAACPALL